MIRLKISQGWCGFFYRHCNLRVGGAVVSWLVRSSLDRAMCSWERYFTLTVPLSHKCVGTSELNAGANPAMD